MFLQNLQTVIYMSSMRKSSTCSPRKNINRVPSGIALALRQIRETDKELESLANEFKQYLIARDYKPSLVYK